MNQLEVIQYMSDFLSVENFQDYCPNGLQVEGDNREVQKICLGVSISEEFIKKAIEINADLIITHHGLFWLKDSQVIRGPMRRKLNLLFDSGIATAAYHLPLDFHPVLGNNAQLAKRLGLTNIEEFAITPKYAEGLLGTTQLSGIDQFSQHVEKVLGRKPTTLAFGPAIISKVAIITGGAQRYFLKAIEAGADIFITGEISESNYAMSQEHGVHFVSAGHYATERFGIIALGKHVSHQLRVSWDLIEISNPI